MSALTESLTLQDRIDNYVRVTKFPRARAHALKTPQTQRQSKMTNDEARRICPGTSKWRRLSEEDAEHVVRMHQATPAPNPRSVPVFDERRPEQHRPAMDEAPWFYDRSWHYLVRGEED